MEAGNRHHDLALAGVAVNLELEGGKVSKARIVCHGVGPQPVRLTSVEDALTGMAVDAGLIRHAAGFSSGVIEAESDIHASGEYRKTILPRLVAHALQQAVSEGGKAA